MEQPIVALVEDTPEALHTRLTRRWEGSEGCPDAGALAVGRQKETSAQRGDKYKRGRQVTKTILAQFSDGQFHGLREIAQAVGVDLAAVRIICNRIVHKGVFQTWGERRRASLLDGSFAYRFVYGGKKIPLATFYAEIQPVLDDMEKLVYGHSVDFSQHAMKMAMVQFRQVIDRVAG
jgi:hypothetical protein